jgi:3-hydroxybutyryl-CoA dehydrogenase
MGVGIAEVVARAGVDVVLSERDAAGAALAQGRVEDSLQTACTRGKIDRQDADAALARISFVNGLDALADRELVVEAIVEDRAAKLAIFRALVDVVADPAAVLTSNTSSIPIVELANAAGDRCANVLGLHFFNPVPVMPLVEVVPSLLTDPAAASRARTFAEAQLGKVPITAPDRAGFTVNALLIPYLLAAIRMVEQGLASAEDIDRGMVNGCAHPMGPLALADLIGLDTVIGVAETLYTEHREQTYAPPPLLQRLVAAGLLGRKTGRGLYDYSRA